MVVAESDDEFLQRHYTHIQSKKEGKVSGEGASGVDSYSSSSLPRSSSSSVSHKLESPARRPQSRFPLFPLPSFLFFFILALFFPFFFFPLLSFLLSPSPLTLSPLSPLSPLPLSPLPPSPLVPFPSFPSPLSPFPVDLALPLSQVLEENQSHPREQPLLFLIVLLMSALLLL